jgi:LysM repeat protein
MRRIATIAMLLLVICIFTGSGVRVHAEGQEQTNQNINQIQKPKEYKVVKVQSGDSLSKIAKKHHSTYRRIFYANVKIKDPNLIFPGQHVRVPNKGMKLKKRSIPGGYKVATTSHIANKPTVAPSTAANYASGSTVWDRLAACESGGNWAINTGNGYYGGLQFTLGSWQAVGGSGYPNQASRSEQIKRGQMLQARSGWGNWPACSAKLGLI